MHNTESMERVLTADYADFRRLLLFKTKRLYCSLDEAKLISRAFYIQSH